MDFRLKLRRHVYILHAYYVTCPSHTPLFDHPNNIDMLKIDMHEANRYIIFIILSFLFKSECQHSRIKCAQASFYLTRNTKFYPI